MLGMNFWTACAAALVVAILLWVCWLADNRAEDKKHKRKIIRDANIARWKATYYPISAWAAAAQGPLAATRHSLVKWKGMDELGEYNLSGVDPFRGYASCSLCALYLDKTPNANSCEGCPLFIIRGHTPCTESMSNEEYSPWHSWREYRNPVPMIELLENAVALEERSEEVKVALNQPQKEGLHDASQG